VEIRFSGRERDRGAVLLVQSSPFFGKTGGGAVRPGRGLDSGGRTGRTASRQRMHGLVLLYGKSYEASMSGRVHLLQILFTARNQHSCHCLISPVASYKSIPPPALETFQCFQRTIPHAAATMRECNQFSFIKLCAHLGNAHCWYFSIAARDSSVP